MNKYLVISTQSTVGPISSSDRTPSLYRKDAARRAETPLFSTMTSMISEGAGDATVSSIPLVAIPL